MRLCLLELTAELGVRDEGGGRGIVGAPGEMESMSISTSSSLDRIYPPPSSVN